MACVIDVASVLSPPTRCSNSGTTSSSARVLDGSPLALLLLCGGGELPVETT